MDEEIIWSSGAANYYYVFNVFRSGVLCFDWYRLAECRLFRNFYSSDNVFRVLGHRDIKWGKDGEPGVEAIGTLFPLCP